MTKINVIKSVLISEGYLCDMDDGSQWSCDQNGANWFQAKPPDNVLTELFNKRSNTGISGKESSDMI